jgi:hypothetical protein
MILKSESYRHESLDLFNKIIQQRRLDIQIIDANHGNTIDTIEFAERLKILKTS